MQSNANVRRSNEPDNHKAPEMRGGLTGMKRYQAAIGVPESNGHPCHRQQNPIEMPCTIGVQVLEQQRAR
jgi:hypothetical protein